MALAGGGRLPSMRGVIARVAKRLRAYLPSHASTPRIHDPHTKTVVMHIGYPKTGTSSLQWFFHARRDDLRAQGVYYPLTGQTEEHAHHRLAFALAENAYEEVGRRERKVLFEDLAAEISQCGCDTVLLSSELFLSRLELIRASAEFSQLFEAKQLRVVCVLRSQETFLESLYRQFILDPTVRFAGPPETFLETYGTVGEYHTKLSAWADFVGKDNLVMMIYEQAVHSGGLIPSFCHLLGVDVGHLAAGDFDVWRNVTHNNVSGIEFMRMANRFPDLTPEQRLAWARQARTVAESTPDIPLPNRLMSATHLEQIRAMFADSNRRLAEDFVHQPLDDFWFPPTPPTEPT
jgi:hypothetical protein